MYYILLIILCGIAWCVDIGTPCNALLCDAVFPWSPVLGLVGSLFGNIFGGSKSSQNADLAYRSAQETNETNRQIARDTNETNVQMVRETNQANLELAQQQNQWNIEQWNRQNEYNSPANQVELFKQAGINPALVGGQFTPAETLTSADLANQQAPQVQGYQIKDPAQAAMAERMQGVEYMKNVGQSLTQFSEGLREWQKTISDIKRNSVLNNVSQAQIDTYAQNIKFMAKQMENIDLDMIHRDGLYLEQIMKMKQEINVLQTVADLNKSDKDYKNQLTVNAETQNDINKVQLEIDKVDLDVWKTLRKSQIAQAWSIAYNQKMQGGLAGFELDFRKNNVDGLSPEGIMQFNLQKNQQDWQSKENQLGRESNERQTGWTNRAHITSTWMNNNTRLLNNNFDVTGVRYMIGTATNTLDALMYSLGPNVTESDVVKAAVKTKEQIDKSPNLQKRYMKNMKLRFPINAD